MNIKSDRDRKMLGLLEGQELFEVRLMEDGEIVALLPAENGLKNKVGIVFPFGEDGTFQIVGRSPNVKVPESSKQLALEFVNDYNSEMTVFARAFYLKDQNEFCVVHEIFGVNELTESTLKNHITTIGHLIRAFFAGAEHLFT